MHELKLNLNFCDDVYTGTKNFEIRKNDRGFQTGDLIKFIPINPNCIRHCDGVIIPEIHKISSKIYKITYVLSGWGLKNGYVVFGIEEMQKCEYCADNKYNVENCKMLSHDECDSDRGMYIYNGELISNSGEFQRVKISYCPMCGRPITNN